MNTYEQKVLDSAVEAINKNAELRPYRFLLDEDYAKAFISEIDDLGQSLLDVFNSGNVTKEMVLDAIGKLPDIALRSIIVEMLSTIAAAPRNAKMQFEVAKAMGREKVVLRDLNFLKEIDDRGLGEEFSKVIGKISPEEFLKSKEGDEWKEGGTKE